MVEIENVEDVGWCMESATRATRGWIFIGRFCPAMQHWLALLFSVGFVFPSGKDDEI